ncbi:hypothetical protein DPMN_054255 [Dreissena polymorpha]|uniref:Uncharacterized protein n=1 Tax=Dreissena polymorpha TaxID=45954 RepID=A0A9D4CQC6_DREPO|nr:hypothetical protein DPMN_054255 [Dreissena polymorpha]
MGELETSTDPANSKQVLDNVMPCKLNTSNDSTQDATDNEQLMAVSNDDFLDNGSNINEKTNEQQEPMSESDTDTGSGNDSADGSESEDCENNESLAPEVNAENGTTLPRATKNKSKGKSSTKVRYRNKRNKKRINKDKQSALLENPSTVFRSVKESHSSNVDTGQSEATFTTDGVRIFSSHNNGKAYTKDEKDQKVLRIYIFED